jgi:hypothetical protein
VTVFTRAFWKDTAERSISTTAQALIAVLGVDGLDWLNIDGKGIAGVAIGSGILSVLKCLAAGRVNDVGTASLVDLPGKHAADR